MAGHLRLRHREAHVREEPARLALADGPLRLDISLCGGRPDDVQPQLPREPLQLSRGHVEDSAREGDSHS